MIAALYARKSTDQNGVAHEQKAVAWVRREAAALRIVPEDLWTAAITLISVRHKGKREREPRT
jgi:hypothetical protein